LVAEDRAERLQRIIHALPEKVAHHLAKELPRHVLDVGAVLPLRHDGAETLDLLLPGGVDLTDVAELGLQLRELARRVRHAHLVGGRGRRRGGVPGRRLDGARRHMISSSACSAPAVWIACRIAIRSWGVTPRALSPPTRSPRLTPGRRRTRFCFAPSSILSVVSGITTVCPCENGAGCETP